MTLSGKLFNLVLAFIHGFQNISISLGPSLYQQDDPLHAFSGHFPALDVTSYPVEIIDLEPNIDFIEINYNREDDTNVAVLVKV